jgi:predicted nucleic acid-binding protein
VLIVDTGPLVATADSADTDHEACAGLLQRETGALRTTALVVAEAAYMIGRRISAEAEATFFRSIANGDLIIDTLTGDDLVRIADLVDTYSDLPLGGTDASLIALAERLQQDRIATLDRRHFSVVRPAHVPGFEIVP